MSEKTVTPGDLVAKCDNCGVRVEEGIHPGPSVAEYICDNCGESVEQVKVVQQPRTVEIDE